MLIAKENYVFVSYEKARTTKFSGRMQYYPINDNKHHVKVLSAFASTVSGNDDKHLNSV